MLVTEGKNVGPEKTISTTMVGWRGREASAVSATVNGRYPRCALAQTILPVHVIGMELNLDHLPDEPVHAAGFVGEVSET